MLPEKWQGKITLNTLEYLTSILTVKFELNDKNHPFPVIATELDSTIADAWMLKLNFNPDDKLHTKCARHLDSLLIN